MKKLLIIVHVFFAIILVGCGKRYNHDVYLSPTNFNEHFNLDIDFVEEDEKTSLVVHLLPRFGLSIKDINVEVKLSYDCLRFKYIEWVSENYKETVIFDNKKSDTHRKVIEIGSINKFKDFQLKEFNLFECSGKISTFETPEYITKGFVTNKKENLVNYNEMNDSIKKLDKLYESNYLNIKITSITKLLLKSGNGQYKSDVAYTNLRADPFYSEVESLSVKSIIKQEGDKYYSYVVLGNNNDITYVSKDLIPFEDVDKSVDIASIFDSTDLDITVDFKPDLNLVQKLDNGYKVTGFYKDLFDDKDYQEVLDMYDEYGYDAKEILSNALFEMIIIVNQESIYMDISVDIFMNEEVYLASTNILMEITFNEFSETDYTNDDNYYILPKNNLEDTNYVTDVTKKINGYYTDDIHVYCTELEKGYYLINDFGYDNYYIYIYNKDKNYTWNILELNNYEDYRDIFYAEESGYYYFEFNFYGYPDGKKYEFQLQKIGDQNYTNFLDDMMIEEGMLKFSIENVYDIIAIRFNSLKRKGLLVFRALDDKYAIFSERYSRIDKQIKGQYEYVFDLYKYENLSYIYGDINDYEYEVILYEKDKYTNTDSPFLMKASEWTDDVVLSNTMPYSVFNIDVEAGYIKFESANVIGNLNDLYFEIYDEDMNLIGYYRLKFNKEYLLEAGKYYIEVNSFSPIISKIRYTFRGVE